MMKLAESDIARDLIVESEIILPVLTYYFADHEPKLKAAWFDTVAMYSSYRKLRWQLENTNNFALILKRIIKTVDRDYYRPFILTLCSLLQSNIIRDAVLDPVTIAKVLEVTLVVANDSLALTVGDSDNCLVSLQLIKLIAEMD
jgi:hypothetical protein